MTDQPDLLATVELQAGASPRERKAAGPLTLNQLAVLHELQRVHGRPITHEALIDAYRFSKRSRAACEWYPTVTESGIRSRCADLVQRGYVVAVDDAGLTTSGRKCARWGVTPAGKVFDITKTIVVDATARAIARGK